MESNNIREYQHGIRAIKVWMRPTMRSFREIGHCRDLGELLKCACKYKLPRTNLVEHNRSNNLLDGPLGWTQGRLWKGMQSVNLVGRIKYR